MAEPPPQPDEVVSPDAKWPPYSKIDTSKHMGELKPVIEFPPETDVPDRTAGVTGFGPGESKERQDILSELTEGQRMRLLAANGIDLRDRRASGQGALRAYVLGSELTTAIEEGVLFTKVICRTDNTDSDRYDRVSFSYTETASNLQRQSVAKTTSSFGVPGIFRLDGSWSNAVAMAESRKDVHIHFEASQVLPKAHIVFDFRDLTPSERLLEEVDAASRKSAVALLGVFKRFGHFVPLSVTVGGRMILSKTTELHNESQFNATQSELKAAAGARFSVEGVPVEVDGGGGMGDWEKLRQIAIAQSMTLSLETKGGIQALASSNEKEAGAKWVDSVGPWRRWHVIGFDKEALVPITDLLPDDMKARCLDLLRAYFVANLLPGRSPSVGPHGDDKFGPDETTLRRVKRIKEILVNHGENLDGLEWTYELYPEAGKPTEGRVGDHAAGHGLGRWRGEHTDRITLAADEIVTCIEVGCDRKEPGCDYNNGTVRKIAIQTNKRRYPQERYFGRANAAEFHNLAAPRIVGFHGFKSALVHCIGPCNLMLSTETSSPDFLLALEPELFPDRRYGPLE
jgi:hypothetical protein